MFTKQLKFAHHLGSLGTNIATQFSNGSVGPPAADSLTSMPSVMYLQLFWILHHSTSVVQLGDYALQWSARFMIKYSDTLTHEEKWKGEKMWKGISLKSILPQVT